MYYKIINRKKRVATRLADLAGYALWAPARALRKANVPSPDGIREVLVVRTAYIGDVVMTMPVLKPLRELYPEARITFLCCKGAEELFKDCPYVDEVISFNAFWFYPGKGTGEYKSVLKRLRAAKFDLVIEARADIRDILLVSYLTGAKYRVSYDVAGGGFLLTHVVPYAGIKHKVEYHLDLLRFLGAKADKIDWGLRLSLQEEKEAASILAGRKGKGPLIGIHPGGRKGLKCWEPRRFTELADRIASSTGSTIFFTGSPAEASLVEEIKAGMRNHQRAVNLAGKTGLRITAAVIKKLDLFITGDSAPLHLASATGAPTVAIFGPSKSRETGPYGNVHRVVEKDFPCRYACDEDVCNYLVHKECMETIMVDDVYIAAMQVLKESGRWSNGLQA